MNKQIAAVLAGIFCFGAAGASAEDITFLRAVRQTQEHGVSVPQNIWKAVPRSSEVYIPSGTSWMAMQRRISAIAEESRLTLTPAEIKTIAYTPQLWKPFETQIGHPMFEGRPLSFEKGLTVLQKNKQRFDLARAEGKYEQAWQEFTAAREASSPNAGKVFEKREELGEVLYNFYVEHIGLENIPRIRVMGAPNASGVVLEIPVNGLQYVTKPGTPPVTVSPDEFVFFREDDGVLFLYVRSVLEQKDRNYPKYRFAVVE